MQADGQTEQKNPQIFFFFVPPTVAGSVLTNQCPKKLFCIQSQRRAPPHPPLLSLQDSAFPFREPGMLSLSLPSQPPESGASNLSSPISPGGVSARTSPLGFCFPCLIHSPRALFDLAGPAFPAAPWGSMKGERGRRVHMCCTEIVGF